MLTLAHIKAAQDNDLAGIRAVLDAMAGRIDSLAKRTAYRLANNPARHSDYADDFRQDAAVALFEALPNYQGDSVDGFFAFMYGHIEATLKGKYNDERNPGADRDAMWVFKEMMERADNDPCLAERLCQTVPPKGRRLSADRAYAARLAWVGAVSLDAPQGEESTLADLLVAETDDPQEVRPKVGRGAVQEALSVLARYVVVPTDSEERRRLVGALIAMREGYANPEHVDSVEETVSVPREAFARRAVLDAVAILRSAASTTMDGELADDLRTASDDCADDRAAKVGTVRAVLDAMAERQADALRYSYGIGGVTSYGTGDSGDLEGLADALGVTPVQARDARVRGHKSFAKRYVKAVAADELQAQALTEAAAANLSRGGRK